MENFQNLKVLHFFISDINEDIWALYLECMCLYLLGEDHLILDGELRENDS